MAVREGTRASVEFICVSILPDVCKSPVLPVPYKILSKFDSAVGFSPNVRFRKQSAFHHNSRLSTVRCNELGVGGGILSGVNLGFCRPIPMTHSKTVRVNGSFVDYHEGTYMFMNCAGPEGPFNTIGQVLFLGNMLPGPVAPGGKIAKSSLASKPSLFANIRDLLSKAQGLIDAGKKLYKLAQTDWSDPSSVLGAMAGMAGMAELQKLQNQINSVREMYDLGDKALNADWNDPKQVLGLVAGAANVANMPDAAQAAQMASIVNDAINTDWTDPRAAMASAKQLLKATGMDQMLASMAENAFSGDDNSSSGNESESAEVASLANNLPASFPPAGSNANGANPDPNVMSIPPSAEGRPRQPITAGLLEKMRQSNPVAAARYDLLSPSDRNRAFVETDPGGEFGDNKTAMYIPGDGFSSTQTELDSPLLPNVSQYIPESIREIFVADKEDATQGNFFGIKEKEGNVYLFGGLVDLGSPEMPGAGTTNTWWIPDRILNMDMAPYYDYHDRNYYGGDVRLSDMAEILKVEVDAFKAGTADISNPLQIPLQGLYSAATTLVGTMTAAKNSAMDFGEATFDSIGDFYEKVFGESDASGEPVAGDSASDGAKMGAPKDIPTGEKDSAEVGSSTGADGTNNGGGGGSGSSSGGGGTGSAGASAGGTGPIGPVVNGGGASGVGVDGILITTAPGSPTAAAAAIEAAFRAENAKVKAGIEAVDQAVNSDQSGDGQSAAEETSEMDQSPENDLPEDQDSNEPESNDEEDEGELEGEAVVWSGEEKDNDAEQAQALANSRDASLHDLNSPSDLSKVDKVTINAHGPASRFTGINNPEAADRLASEIATYLTESGFQGSEIELAICHSGSSFRTASGTTSIAQMVAERMPGTRVTGFQDMVGVNTESLTSPKTYLVAGLYGAGRGEVFAADGSLTPTVVSVPKEGSE